MQVRGFKDKVIFDFQLPNKQIANFIAIYAPNGFGKTSFFDGVEWAVTGSIERLTQNSKIMNAARDSGGFILKNKESTVEKGTVSLIDSSGLNLSRFTSSSDNWDLLPGRTDSKSTSPLKTILQVKHNKRMEILPQSRIDSFLSSTTPEEKYEALLACIIHKKREKSLESLR